MNAWSKAHTIGTIAITLGIGIAGYWLPRFGSWLMTLALLIVFLVIAGQGITGRLDGVLIDERNKMSLARFQLILWTVLILASYLAAALGNLKAGVPDPLAIAIPQDLWILMGISTTSLVGSPLLKGNKRTRQPDAAEAAVTVAAMASQGLPTNALMTQGLLVVNTTTAAARWSDMFRGEETGNASILDVAKVQMFFFTLIVVVAYAFVVGSAMRGTVITELPDLSDGVVALLGISHAGYLTSKGITHSQTA